MTENSVSRMIDKNVEFFGVTMKLNISNLYIVSLLW